MPDITLKGRLKGGIVAIGGETTGFLLVLDTPLQVGNVLLHEVEMESKDVDLHPYLEQEVEVVGEVTTRWGVERGEYWIIIARSVKVV